MMLVVPVGGDRRGQPLSVGLSQGEIMDGRTRCLLLLVLGFVWVNINSACMYAQVKVDPAVRERLDREFAAAHPQPGDYLPVCRLAVVTDKAEDYSREIRYAGAGSAKLLMTASLTCPKTRQHLPAIQQLAEKYGKALGITIVYVIEAHPEKDVCPYLGVVDVTEANVRDNILFRQPTTMDGRMRLAKLFAERYPMPGAILVDSMDNVAWRILGQSPNAALLSNSDGQVILRQAWIDPSALEPEIEKLIARDAEEQRQREQSYRRKHVVSDELEELMKRVDPDLHSQWEVVRRLEKVDLPHLKAVLAKYPKVIHDTLVYGAHDQSESSILQLMVERKDRQLVEAAIAAGADLNQQVRESTALSTAVSIGSLEMVDLLIRAGADPKKNPDPGSRSLMHQALLDGRQDIAKRLLQAGIAADIFSQCGMGLLDDVHQQIKDRPSSGLRYDGAGNIPLTYAVACNQPEVVRMLLKQEMIAEAGSSYSDSPVERAAVLESAEIMGMLLQHLTAADINRSSAPRLALNKGKLEQFKMLLDAKIDLTGTRRCMTLLHEAAYLHLPIEFARALLEHGADLHVLTTGYSDDGCGPSDPKSSEESALHLAARTLKPQHVALFLSQGAKPDVRDQAGLTPLAAAILQTLQAAPERRDLGLATIQALIAGGRTVDTTDSKGNIIRDMIAQVIKQPTPVALDNKQADAYVVRPTQYRGPTGFDAQKIPPSELLERIDKLLRP